MEGYELQDSRREICGDLSHQGVEGLQLIKVLWPHPSDEERIASGIAHQYLTSRDLSVADFHEHGWGFHPTPYQLVYVYRDEAILMIDQKRQIIEQY